MNDPMQPDRPMQHRLTCGQFGGRTKQGMPCGGPVIAGTDRCRMHSGKRGKQAIAEGRVRLEVRHWGITGQDEPVDPGEFLLRLVTQSAARIDFYGRLVGEAYEAAERLAAAHEAGEFDAGNVPTTDNAMTVVQDLKRIFNTGGVAALIGHQYAATKDGDIYATGEAVRGLVELEGKERERGAGFAAKAIAAGLAERQVRVAEQIGATLVAKVLAAIERARPALSGEQRSSLLEELIREIEGIAGPMPKVIEGVAR